MLLLYNLYKTPKFEIKTQDELEKLAEEWIKDLRLQEWEISVRLVNDIIFYEQHITGINKINALEKKAIINIMSMDGYYDSYEDAEVFDYDMEATLVHELLHCTFCETTDLAVEQLTPKEEKQGMESVGYVITHRLLEQMAQILVSMKRKGVNEKCEKKNKTLINAEK